MLILVVDDDPGFREQLRRLLGSAGQLEVVEVVEAAEGDEAVQLAAILRPEVVLMDIAMPRTDGLEATRRIKAARKQTKVIMLTVHDEEPYRQAARESGADAFVVKRSAGVELIASIQAVVRMFPAASTTPPPDSTVTGGTTPSAP